MISDQSINQSKQSQDHKVSTHCLSLCQPLLQVSQFLSLRGLSRMLHLSHKETDRLSSSPSTMTHLTHPVIHTSDIIFPATDKSPTVSIHHHCLPFKYIPYSGKLRGRKLLRIATKLRNSRKFSPSKVFRYMVLTCLMCSACCAAMPSMADLHLEICQQQ